MKPSRIIGGLLIAALVAGAVTAGWKIAASRRAVRPPAVVETPAERAAREAAAVESELLAFPAQLTRYLKGDEAQRSAQRVDFLKIAASRRTHLCRMAAAAPAKAVTFMLPLSQLEDLPAELRDELERFVSLRADVVEIQRDSAAGATPAVCRLQVRLPGDDEPRSGYSWGDAWASLRGRTVPVQVWLLGDAALIEAGFLHPLTAADLAALRSRYELANPDADRCLETDAKITGAPTAALSGGKLLYFRDSAAAETFGRKLLNLELQRASRPPPPAD